MIISAATHAVTGEAHDPGLDAVEHLPEFPPGDALADTGDERLQRERNFDDELHDFTSWFQAPGPAGAGIGARSCR